MEEVDVHYARSGDLRIAYATFGDGPVDFVFIPGFVSHLEKHGTGMSDPFVGVPTLKERIDDVRAVMDAVDSTSSFVCGLSEGGPMSILFSATYPTGPAD